MSNNKERVKKDKEGLPSSSLSEPPEQTSLEDSDALDILIFNYGKTERGARSFVKVAKERGLSLLGCIKKQEWELEEKGINLDNDAFCKKLYARLRDNDITDELPWYANQNRTMEVA
jgi:hypothetical protein